MNEFEDKKYTITHSGDHHLAQVKYDPSTEKISAGGIYSFSNNASASMKIVDNKVSGTLLNSGDTHNIKLEINNDGSFEGVYEDKKDGNVKIGITGGMASVISGEFPVNGVDIEADHHIIKLVMDENKQISGQIESKTCDNSTFMIKIDKGKVSGSLTYFGGGHENSIEIFPDGKWKASVSVGSTSSSKLSFSVENGDAGVRAFAGLKLPI